MLLALEGFGEYASPAGMSASGRWLHKSTTLAISNGTGPGGASEIHSTGFYNRFAITKPFAQKARVAASFDVRLPESWSGVARIALNPAGWHTRAAAVSTGALYAIDIYVENNIPTVYHRVPSAATGAGIASSLVLGSLPAWIPGNTYHIEILADLSSAESTVAIRVNGAETSFNFMRDRVNNGFQATQLGELSFASIGAYASSRAHFSNVVIYEPTAEMPFPQGPIDVLYCAAQNANLGANPPNDATSVSIASTAWASFDISDLPAGAGAILGADMRIRLAASGQVAASVEHYVEIGGQISGDVRQDAITPGQAAKIVSNTIATPLTAAQLNSAKFKIRSVA